MSKVLFLLPSLDYSGDAYQAALLARMLPRDEFSVECVSMGGEGPLAESFHRAKVPLHGHVGRRFFDIEDWLALRRLIVNQRPDVIHVWGVPALRTLRLATVGQWRRLPPLLVSSAARTRRPDGIAWWSRRLLRRASGAVAASGRERDALIEAGVDSRRLHIVPPAAEGVPPPPDIACLRAEIGVPDRARILIAVGRMEAMDRFHNAIWAFDILRYLFPDLHLVLVGDGQARAGLEAFGRTVARNDWRIHFTGARADAASLLHLAEVVWAPYRRPGGTTITLQAMAIGKPVVASALPNLEAILQEGETGFLVSPHDAPALARRTRELLDNPALATTIGMAARGRFESEFVPSVMAARFSCIYHDLSNAHPS